MAKSKHYYIRKAHRYLGLILGIQFLLWTIGGLYFSWSNMDEVHGDFQKKPEPLLPANLPLVSPTVALNNIREIAGIDSLTSIQLIQILGKPYYQIRSMGATGNNHSHDHSGHQKIFLVNAETGQLRPALSEHEAVAVAKLRFNGNPKVAAVEYLTTTSRHHEYRESPLPAYAITFEHPSATTVYVASEWGTVQKFRNNKWRTFDLLWMLHTMDYESRDNISNILLRVFSVFGLVTVISGFVLYAISSKTLKNGFKKQGRLAINKVKIL
ncbi:hypothetical protein [Chitinophaga japonensis]|uniref:PepSY-associated transmembrane protein n=1 Tax=Chitinophaga japonensis TaxID=104662 RepID=A0A562SNB6_CHIJA|nr:hypothetical protein [Chitinophaga japonensis]TWI82623.1 hypothetical protein LX66_5198 [Chitinophaga japonensis]